MTNKSAVVIRFEAANGKEKQAEKFLESSKEIVAEEPGTMLWNVARITPRTFSVFGVFDSERSRQQHLDGEFPKLLSKSTELFSIHPVIEKADVIAQKIGEPEHVH